MSNSEIDTPKQADIAAGSFSEPVDDEVDAENIKVPVAVEIDVGQIRDLLHEVRDANDLDQVGNAIMALDQILEQDEEIAEPTAHCIAANFGAATLLISLEKWQPYSGQVAGLTLHTLVNITHYAKDTIPLILETGIRTVLAAARRHPQDYLVRSCTTGLLYNICDELDEDSKICIADDNCINSVLESMEMFSEDQYIIDRGCHYLHETGVNAQVKKSLIEKEACLLLESAMDTFCNSNPEIYAVAQKVLFRFSPISFDETFELSA